MEQKFMIPYGKLIMVWMGLVMLTALTITVAGLHFGQWSVLAAIAIATVKGALVLMFFMNLKYEDRVFQLMLLVALLTMTVILVLTFVDVSLR